MAFGATKKETKKKLPTASVLKKENTALKSEVESLTAQLAEAKKAAAAVPKTVEVTVPVSSDSDVELARFKSALKVLCRHHPVIKEHITAAGLIRLL